MNRNVLIVVVVLFFSSGYAFAQADTLGMLPSSSNAAVSNNYVIDDFFDGEIDQNPSWWQFGELSLVVAPNGESNYGQNLGRQALRVDGKARARYLGGLGTYLALNGTNYNALELEIYGTGPNSGRLKIELYDDDNGNYVIEPSQYVPGRIVYDDRFVYEFPIDWNGWNTVKVPLEMFYDNNPKVGDDIWNPDHKNGSGGLVQLQLIVSASKNREKVKFRIGTVRLYLDPAAKMPLPPNAEVLHSSIEDENIDYNIAPGR